MKGKPRQPKMLQLMLVSLFVIALGLHTWGLGWFNSLVFDEVYYVPFGLNYLQGQPFFDAHPPLGKYLIALGMALTRAPALWLNWPTLEVDGQFLSPIGYRWLNALTGSALPVLSALLGFQLSAVYGLQRRVAFGLVTGVLVLLGGLTLVESRFALINIYWLWFGLLGLFCWVKAKTLEGNLAAASAPSTGGGRPRYSRPMVWRIAAGIALGAAINVKWNGAGFWLGLLILELGLRWQVVPRSTTPPRDWKGLGLYLGLVPLVTYSVLWLPHLWINQVSLVGVHRSLWVAHQNIGNAVSPHPYCSAWYTWPLMLRPVSYLYERVSGLPADSILAPPGATPVTTYTVQGMGNPILWWLATAAVLALGIGQLSRWWGRSRRLTANSAAASNTRSTSAAVDGGACSPRGDLSSPHLRAGETPMPVVSFVLVNYCANWLPWMLVQRCTFLYHGLGMLVFSTLALAWLLSRWLLDHRWHHRIFAWVMLLAVLLGFWFWLPVLMGLPLSPEALRLRWWLKSWI